MPNPNRVQSHFAHQLDRFGVVFRIHRGRQKEFCLTFKGVGFRVSTIGRADQDSIGTFLSDNPSAFPNSKSTT